MAFLSVNIGTSGRFIGLSLYYIYISVLKMGVFVETIGKIQGGSFFSLVNQSQTCIPGINKSQGLPVLEKCCLWLNIYCRVPFIQ